MIAGSLAEVVAEVDGFISGGAGWINSLDTSRVCRDICDWSRCEPVTRLRRVILESSLDVMLDGRRVGSRHQYERDLSSLIEDS